MANYQDMKMVYSPLCLLLSYGFEFHWWGIRLSRRGVS